MKPAVRYGFSAKLLHRLAYSGSVFQKSLAELDTSIHRKTINSSDLSKPVFIAGLARSGTTALLNILHETQAFASASYRDMPFVYAPMLWNTLTRHSQKKGNETVRAHDDGILISEESPEAFDEVLWKLWFPEKYGVQRISLWNEDDIHEEFETAFRDFTAKIIQLRSSEGSAARRFLSKTNGSISRLPILRKLFPEALIIIPFRDPMQHALSLHNQDVRFSALQKEDPFILRYMSDLGHHEFGSGKKLVAFPGLDSANNANTIEEWLGYWEATYSHLLSIVDENTVLFDYDHACANSDVTIAALLKRLDVDEASMSTVVSRFEIKRMHDSLLAAPERCMSVLDALRTSPNNLTRA